MNFIEKRRKCFRFNEFLFLTLALFKCIQSHRNIRIQEYNLNNSQIRENLSTLANNSIVLQRGKGFILASEAFFERCEK